MISSIFSISTVITLSFNIKWFSYFTSAKCNPDNKREKKMFGYIEWDCARKLDTVSFFFVEISRWWSSKHGWILCFPIMFHICKRRSMHLFEAKSWMNNIQPPLPYYICLCLTLLQVPDSVIILKNRIRPIGLTGWTRNRLRVCLVRCCELIFRQSRSYPF